MTRTYLICRTATQPLGPGCVLGYECQVCHHPLQVSPVGVKAIRYDGGIPLCNPCPKAALAKNITPAQFVILTPQAKDQLQRMARGESQPGRIEGIT